MKTAEIKKLALIALKADPSKPQAAYSFGGESFDLTTLNEALRDEFRALAPNYNEYRKNQYEIFALMREVIDTVLPERVMQQYMEFAEIKHYAQGEKPVFSQKISAASRRRAKRFITTVGLAGVYEVFKLDGASFEVKTSAIGGAAQIGFEEFLDGRVDFSELVNIVMEGMDEKIYELIANALNSSFANLQSTNKTSQASFVEKEMDKLIAIADSYGGKSTIYCTFEFAATMIPSAGWISDNMKDQMWNNGYLANYKGHNVVVLQQSFVDETNTAKVMDSSRAYIIATGAEKPIKIAFEGDLQVREVEANHDWSREIQMYKKVGVGALITNNICIYENTSLK